MIDIERLLHEAVTRETPLVMLLGTIENAEIRIRRMATEADADRVAKIMAEELNKIFMAFDDYKSKRGF